MPRLPVLAFDLGGTKLSCALVDESGKLSARTSEAVDVSSPKAPIEQMVHMADGKFSAIGVAVPGLVRRDGTVWAPNLPRWDRVPLARMLQRHLKVPVIVESDRNAVVIGEAWRGAARGKSDVIVLIVGTGIGAGIVSGGSIVRGAHELSGCAGWLVVTEKDSAMMRRIGCLETLAAGPSVQRAAKRPPAEVATAARNGDRASVEIFERVGRWLGLGVANLISLFDPEVVVLTGGLTEASDLFLPTLKRVARERAQPLSAPRVRIVVSRLGGDANLLGAAKLALATQRSGGKR